MKFQIRLKYTVYRVLQQNQFALESASNDHQGILIKPSNTEEHKLITNISAQPRIQKEGSTNLLLKNQESSPNPTRSATSTTSSATTPVKKLSQQALPVTVTTTTTVAPSSTKPTVTSSTDTLTTKSDTIDFSKTYVTPHALENYNELINLIKSKQKEFKTIFSADQIKTYKYELQNAINFLLNSLLEDETNADNKRNFHDKIKTILSLLNGETCIINSTLTVNPTKHPKAIEYSMDYLAKKLVEKGEKSVSNRPGTAFQYVQLAIAVMKQHPSFKNILIAYFYDKCLYTVPYYKPRLKNQSIEEYFETLGYKMEEGKVEEEDFFHNRMSGILHLYFTLLIDPDYKDGAKQAWIWLSDTLNMKPRANITAHMLAIFFKCCGYQLQRIYRQEFIDTVNSFFKNYLPHIKSIKDDKAFLGRLELILGFFEKKGHFNEWKKIVLK